MRATLTDKEIDIAVDLLINKYKISTRFLNEFIGKQVKSQADYILKEMKQESFDKKSLCRMIIITEGVGLLSGSDNNTRLLRKKILDSLSDDEIIKLYEKYPSNGNNITTASYMRKPLSEKRWHSGKMWAKDFVRTTGFPLIFAGIQTEKENQKNSIEIIEPRRKTPELVPYQIIIRDELKNILEQRDDRSRCMISLPTGGGKTRVAVEAFLDWMESSFDDGKYLIWLAQSEELCEQSISCVEDMWRDREFVLPLKVYRFFSKYGNFPEDKLTGGVVVASINKLYYGILNKDDNIVEILKNTKALIIDEAHRASTMMYDTLFELAEKATEGRLFSICGLSATPGRNALAAQNDVHKLVSRFHAELITPNFSDNPKYCENPLNYFKDEGYLSKVNHIVYKTGIEYQLSDDELEELSKINAEYTQAFLKEHANDSARNKLIIERLLKIKENKPTLVYACTVEHAKFLSAMMNSFNRKSAFIDSNTNKAERRMLIKEFTSGGIEFLFNFGVLTTGFDAPKTQNIVICRPINSEILYEQIVGRGIRGPRFGGTEECNVIDFSDNISNLGKQQTFMRFKNYWDKESEEK
ncbi:DEAD/DEAH box helicase [Fusibacter tunisiensis]|uniref:Superfamily II DNA or RNA helicase n=1 Tax=Fusibacter tunisiensis TaxID=1008308 RepID=A0ABS2MT12_9FIRM|nr:DEAD/DEAH box helicase family protein [Fusibacter tunisiensis]MBM7562512.1 superfamily II DNA or RNA helicase [Fusibacter tunisiensis]